MKADIQGYSKIYPQMNTAIVKAETSTSYMTKLLTRDKVKMFRDNETAVDFLRAMVRVDTGHNLTASV